MIRCTIDTEWGALSPSKLKDPDFVRIWNEAVAELQFHAWTITQADVEKANHPETKSHDYKHVSAIKRPLSYSDMCTVGRLPGVKVTFDPDESSMLVKLEERLQALSLRIGEIERPAALAAGAAAIIHVPDQSLLYVDEVTWEDDCCTERLQDRLDEGWRILAVCPPNSQRRPDYILGRRKSRLPMPLAYAHNPVPEAKTDPALEEEILF